MRSRSRGFTLIELMIVIGILLVLMVALVPAVSIFTGKANKTACQMNLQKHLFQGALVYSSGTETNGMMPEGAGRDVLESLLVYGLVENAQHLICPASTAKPAKIRTTAQDSAGTGEEEDGDWSAYRKKVEIVGGLKPDNCSYKWTSTARKNGERMVLAADRDGFHDGGYNVLYANGTLEFHRKPESLPGWKDLKD